MDFRSTNFRSVEYILGEIWEEQNRNPNNWHVLAGVGVDYKLNLYVTNKRSLWQIKAEPHIGVGVRIDDEKIVDEFVKNVSLPSFGYRQLPNELTERVIRELKEYGDITPKTRAKIHRYAPLKENEITKLENVFGATPVILPLPIIPVAESAIEIDTMLKKELRKRINDSAHYT